MIEGVDSVICVVTVFAISRRPIAVIPRVVNRAITGDFIFAQHHDLIYKAKTLWSEIKWCDLRKNLLHVIKQRLATDENLQHAENIHWRYSTKWLTF